MTELKDLKKEADELGVTYAKNITAEKLAEKIDAFYGAKETPDPAVEAALAEANEVKEAEKSVETPKAVETAETDPAKMTPEQKRWYREKKARETRVVTIVDNDQRVNNHTTTCTVNCSNEFFDLGTIILPLNEKIEVAMGHIRTLEAVKIPLHVTDTKTGMATVRLRPRYTISYENMK